MMQWLTLFKKEVMENWRNRKWIWVPLVFILLAIMDPITSYYLPQIIDAVGGLPEGSVIELPEIAPAEVMMMSLSQFSSFGVLIIVLISMGTIAGERKSGALELTLVKPVSSSNYITSKWVSFSLLVLIAFFIGMLGSWYYTNLLFGDLSFKSLLLTFIFYSFWFIFVLSLSIFINTLVKRPGMVAFLSIATIIVMSIFTQIFSHKLPWIPNLLSEYILEMLTTEQIPKNLVATLILTLAISILLVFFSVYTFQKKEVI